MEVQLLYFFKNIATPFLDIIANFSSYLAEDAVLICLIIVIYYGYSKKKAYAIFTSLTTALLTTCVFKAIVKTPRPFVSHPELLSQRLETATGYSFPSGHTTNSSAFYPTIGRLFKNNALLIIGIIIAVFTMISRLYLRVHYLSDVTVGLMIGLLFSLALSPIFESLYVKKSILIRYFALLLFLTATALTIGLEFFNLDPIAYKDLLKVTALAFGGHFAVHTELNTTNFKEDSNIKYLIPNLLLCVLGVALIMVAESFTSAYIGYFSYLLFMPLLSYWAIGLYPKVAIKLLLLRSQN